MVTDIQSCYLLNTTGKSKIYNEDMVILSISYSRYLDVKFYHNLYLSDSYNHNGSHPRTHHSNLFSFRLFRKKLPTNRNFTTYIPVLFETVSHKKTQRPTKKKHTEKKNTGGQQTFATSIRVEVELLERSTRHARKMSTVIISNLTD
jgi:hypothetical protein